MILRFSLLQLVGLVSFAGLASAALVQPGPGWLSVVVTLTVAILLWQILRAVLLAGEARAAAVGWALFATTYLALAIGPWLNEQVGPTLLSSKSLAYAQEHWRKESVQDSSAESLRRLSLDLWGLVPTPAGTSNTVLLTDYSLTNLNGRIYRTADSYNAMSVVPVNCFRTSGQWLFAWLAGWLGAAIAVFLHRRAEGAKPKVGA